MDDIVLFSKPMIIMKNTLDGFCHSLYWHSLKAKCRNYTFRIHLLEYVVSKIGFRLIPQKYMLFWRGLNCMYLVFADVFWYMQLLLMLYLLYCYPILLTYLENSPLDLGLGVAIYFQHS